MTVKIVVKVGNILKDGRTNVYLSLRARGSSRAGLLSTGKRIFPYHWDTAARQVKDNAPNAQALNNFLREQIQTLEAIILEQQRAGLTPSYDSVFKQYQGQTVGTKLADYIPARMKRLKPRVAPKTYEDYRGALARLLAYQPNVRFEDISTEWLRDYEAVQQQKGRKPNGIFRDFSVLRKFFNEAREENLVKHYPFKNFKLPREETVREFLLPAELDRMDTFFWTTGDVLPLGQYKTLGFYLFSCYTGLTHDDLIKRRDWQWILSPTNNKLIIRRGKTASKGELTAIPLSSRALRLVEHVQTHSIKLKKKRMVEDMTAICHRLQINKHLTYHTARHTFAVNSLMRGINIKVIQKILGHSSVSTTEVYLRIVDEYMDTEMLKWERPFGEDGPVERTR